MRALLLIGCFAAFPAKADLYRWVDPQTGSVKYSSVAPSWYGDAEQARSAPPVELLPSVPTAKASEAPKSDPAVAALEARWRTLLQSFSALAAGGGLERAGPDVQRQLEAYQALVAELDRRDPAGTARRRAEEASLAEKLRK